jgi:hypothetical protein
VDKSFVSIENKVCPICLSVHSFNCGILLDRRLKDSLDSTTITGYGYCEDCSSHLKDYIAIIEVVDGGSRDAIPAGEINRSGTVVWISRTVADQIITGVEIKDVMLAGSSVIEVLREMAGL